MNMNINIHFVILLHPAKTAYKHNMQLFYKLGHVMLLSKKAAAPQQAPSP
jgi:hypothetical protein